MLDINITLNSVYDLALSDLHLSPILPILIESRNTAASQVGARAE